MRFLGLDEFHEAGFRLVDKILFLQDDAEGIADVEKDGLDIGGHHKVLLINIEYLDKL